MSHINSPQAPEARGETSPHALQSNGVSAAGSIVMAVAGSAPAYSIAATTATLVAVAGLGAPAALLWCGIPMLGIAWAFMYLGRADVNAGAAYSWVARALTPALGFLSGWALVISATIFMVAGALPAGAMTVSLFDPTQAENVPLITGVGAIWFVIMAACVYFGVHVTARAQWIMSIIEVGILFVFAGLALFRAATTTHAGPDFSWDWLGFSHLTGQGIFVAAALIAAFYYWGWDVSSNLNEETTDGHKSAGAAGLIGVGIVFVLFEVFTIATLIMLPADDIEANSANILSVLGDVIWPGIGGKILIIAVALSTIATLETTLIQVTRTLFAMGRDHTIPSAFGRVSPRWKTPTFATLVILGISLVLFVGSNFLGSVGDIMSNAISSIGLQIAFYYTLAGVAVVVAYRRVLFQSVKNFILIGLWPASGAVFMGWAFFVSIPGNDPLVNWLGIGLIVLGVVPLLVFYPKAKTYYSRRPLEVPPELDKKAPAAIDLRSPEQVESLPDPNTTAIPQIRD
ncbi:APC family permease [Microbacterium rhizomatis]|uniref:APC family permease n=1 Tax=Microbacterium rhizomatis TaxID=1631477 RepID=A0A5J5J6J5_9MICO|nr:APC family permease [Microbacterium rhizomatis]KAA9110595.1 APC family permease [Microbacterium rhizomatis]